MLPKIHRLAKAKDVQQTYARGRSFFSPHFLLKARFGGASVRFAFVVSTKVSKRAVVRNRIRRILRETIRMHLKAIKPADYIFTVKPAALHLVSGQLREQSVLFLKQSKVLYYEA